MAQARFNPSGIWLRRPIVSSIHRYYVWIYVYCGLRKIYLNFNYFISHVTLVECLTYYFNMYSDQLLGAVFQVHVVYLAQLLGAVLFIHFKSNHDRPKRKKKIYDGEIWAPVIWDPSPKWRPIDDMYAFFNFTFLVLFLNSLLFFWTKPVYLFQFI